VSVFYGIKTQQKNVLIFASIMHVDYIVVGIGLAGINFCEQLKANNKSFVVFDNKSQKSSTVAAGLYNPVVLKRFTSVWKSKEQLKLALPVYKHLEKKLNVKLDYKIPVYRKFASLEEQNDWFTASDKLNLSEYLSEEPFNYNSLKSNNNVEYKNIEAKHIVFAEGFGVVKNPFFNQLPLVPTKGELLIIQAPDLKINYVLKAGVFIVPLKDNLYTVGATYNWDDTTHKITVKAKEELLTKLKTIIECDFKVVNQVAGIRPTVKDRRPLVGKHKIYKNMFILNGLGTRGVMIGPYVAKQLFNFIENKIPLEQDIDIKRFE